MDDFDSLDIEEPLYEDLPSESADAIDDIDNLDTADPAGADNGDEEI